MTPKRTVQHLAVTWLVLVAWSVHMVSEWNREVSSRRILEETSQPAQQQQQLRDGWHTIQVFYGKQDLYIPDIAPGKWFSQAQQDRIVASLTRNQTHGYFVDLAANDAVHISNTLALEQKFHWHGLCIEANPEYWLRLSYRQCQVVAAVVGKERMEKVTFHPQKVMGGIVREDFDNSRIKKNKDVSYYTASLEEILEQNHAPSVIDYLSLDVEGAESYVMTNFPFDKYKIKILTVERPKQDLVVKLQQNGYQFVRHISGFGETLWVHCSFVDSLDLDSQKKFRQFPKANEKKRNVTSIN